MNCTDAHLAIGAEPNGSSPELEQHLRECAGCADYRRELRQLDEKILRALKVDLPPRRMASSSRAPVPPLALRQSSRHWALAASVLFAVAVVFVLWGALPRHSLAADVVAHVISEPLPGEPARVPTAEVDAVLKLSNVELDPLNREVVFARTCFFRGRLVPHLVVRTTEGLVTVLLLPAENVKTPERFEYSGYTGILLPDAGHGSIAVLSRADFDVEREAREIFSVLRVAPRA